MGNGLYTLNDIINEASTGEMLLDGCLPLLFQTYEMNYAKLINRSLCTKYYPDLFIPNMIIIDQKKLNNTLDEFINNASTYYENDLNYINSKNPIKYLLCNTLSNALLNEFDDIRLLFNRYLAFFKIERLKDFLEPKNIGYSSLLCGNIIVGVVKEPVSSVAPLSFHISIERLINNKLFYYDFPCIKYGIYNGTSYIFSIENVLKRTTDNIDKTYKQELTEYQNTIDNLLQKSINIKEINYQNVFILSAFLSFLNKRSIKEIIVPTVIINRYNGYEIGCYKRIKQYNDIFEEASIKSDSKALETTLAKISVLKENIASHALQIKKKNFELIKCFKYIEENFLDFKIYDYPLQKDTNLHMFIIDDTYKSNNKLLNELTTIIKDIEK